MQNFDTRRKRYRQRLIARAIHQQSLRADKPFVKVDVGALTETLFESELFGHKKGSFSAGEERPGRFEAANGGTFFLMRSEIFPCSNRQNAKCFTKQAGIKSGQQ